MIAQEPCYTCDDNRQVSGEPPYWVCRRSATGDHECQRLLTVQRIAERAAQVAALIAKEPDRRLRAEEASVVCDAYADVLYGLGARLDDAAFLAACCVPRGCAICSECSTSDDSPTCTSCTQTVAA